MAICALRDFNARHGGKEPLAIKWSTFKSFSVQLAVDYPTFAIVIYQH